MNTIAEESEPWGGAEVPKDFHMGVDAEDVPQWTRKLVAQAAWAAARDATNRVQVPAHVSGRVMNGEKTLLRIIIGALAGLLTAAGIGFWSLYGVVSHVSQEVADYHQQDAQNSERNHQDIQQIDQILERRYGN